MMWPILFALILVVVCWTGAGAGPREDADSALERGEFTLAVRLFRPFTEQVDVRKGRQAARAEEKGSSLYVGRMFEKGRGFPQANILAYMWYAIAAAML